jgi:hypothetical protein
VVEVRRGDTGSEGYRVIGGETLHPVSSRLREVLRIEIQKLQEALRGFFGLIESC